MALPWEKNLHEAVDESLPRKGVFRQVDSITCKYCGNNWKVPEGGFKALRCKYCGTTIKANEVIELGTRNTQK